MIALDTNVLVYAFDQDDGAKSMRAQRIIASAGAVPMRLPLQVVSETFVVLSRRRGWTKADARMALEALMPHIPVHPATLDDAFRAMSLSEKHDVSYWDALIVAVAASSGCDTLLSEDFQDGRSFAKSDVSRALRIVDPFNEANLQFLEAAGLLSP